MAQLPSTFNLDSFQNASFEGVGDTKRLRVPEGDFNAVIVGPWGERSKLRVQQGQGGTYLIADIVWKPSDPKIQSELGVEELPTVRQSIFLDLTPGGGLDMGPYKNTELNLLLTVFGLGTNGAPWKWSDLIGRPARVKTKHNANEKNPLDPFVNVTAVTKI